MASLLLGAALLASPAPAAPRLDVVGVAPLPVSEAPVLDLAFIERDLVAVLTPARVFLHELRGGAVVLRAEAPLPASGRVRRAGGLLLADGSGSFWAMTSVSQRAVLFDHGHDRLVERMQAEALPWSRIPAGVRFRSGTNVLEPAAGPGARWLALEPDVGGVDVDGHLVLEGKDGVEPTDVRTGDSMAALGGGWLAASSSVPPGPKDAILLVAIEDAGVRLADSFPVAGAVRALAAQRAEGGTRLLAAEEEPRGATRLVIMNVRLPTP